MTFQQYEGKRVRIVDINGRTFEGVVTDYIYPDEDDTGSESIIVDCQSGPLKDRGVEFWQEDIKSIEVI